MAAPPSPVPVPRADDVPVLGLGTWQNDDHEECLESVRTALEGAGGLGRGVAEASARRTGKTYTQRA